MKNEPPFEQDPGFFRKVQEDRDELMKLCLEMVECNDPNSVAALAEHYRQGINEISGGLGPPGEEVVVDESRSKEIYRVTLLQFALYGLLDCIQKIGLKRHEGNGGLKQ